jgi:predicted RecB family nuclease
MMPFRVAERAKLLTVKGVGPTVIQRLEEAGITTLEQLSRATTTDIVSQVAATLGSSCWKNSPKSRASIDGAIACAKAARPKKKARIRT